MITRLEITGFKTFTDFSIGFTPFTIIAGPNGSGKSNLFDAIQLLGTIAETDLQSAFTNQRGESQELFTLNPNGSYADTMRFAVELLLSKNIRDKFGGQAELRYTRLRYEVVLRRGLDQRGFERLTVAEERLFPIAKATDDWFRVNTGGNAATWRPSTHGGTKPFIDTRPIDPEAPISEKEIFIRQDGSRGGRPSPVLETEQTMLSSVSKIDFPHVFAVKQEMISWRFLQLNPVELRKPSPLLSLAKGTIAPDGSNLPTALARMEADAPGTIRLLSREVHRLLPGIQQVELVPDEAKQQYIVYATMTDGRRFSSRVLSEGTLRLIVLCAFKYDSQYEGVLCFEEPENGIHPYRLHHLVQLLHDLSTDFSETEEPTLRQLLVNTHSPGLLAALVSLKQSAPSTALFASLATHVAPGEQPSQRTKMLPITFTLEHRLQPSLPLENQRAASQYSLQEAIHYLKSADVELALAELISLQSA